MLSKFPHLSCFIENTDPHIEQIIFPTSFKKGNFDYKLGVKENVFFVF